MTNVAVDQELKDKPIGEQIKKTVSRDKLVQAVESLGLEANEAVHISLHPNSVEVTYSYLVS